MATNTLKLRISNKVDTRANWGSSSLVLKKGELAFDEMNTFKIGNGSATWSELPFAGGGAVKITTVDPTASDTGFDLGQLWLNTTSADLFVMTAAGAWEKVVFAADLEAVKSDLEGKIALKANAADVFTKTEMEGSLALKANAADVYTKTAADALISVKADASSVYTKGEVDSALAPKADTATVNAALALKADAESVYTKVEADALLAKKAVATEVSAALDLKANAADVYVKSEVDSAVAVKANVSDVYNKTEIDTKVGTINTAIDKKANAADVYTKTEADALINVKANAADVYTKTESDSALALKANAADVYTKTAADELLAKKADLDENGHVLASQLPSYVDDVIEGASLEAFPAQGEGGKIYVALDTNKTYRWSGSQYTVISDTIALGTTAGTAFEGSAGAELAQRIADIESVITGGEAGGLGALAYLDTVASAQIDDGAVVTAKIGDAQVTDAKIVSISLDKITESAGAEVVLDCGDSSED